MGIFYDSVYMHKDNTDKPELELRYCGGSTKPTKDVSTYYDDNSCRYTSMDWVSLNNIMDTCRYRHKGKPISSWGRLRDLDNGDIALYIGYGSQMIWSVSKNNIVTFHQDSSRAGGQTSVASMPNWFPVGLFRLSTGDYRVIFGKDLAKYKLDNLDRANELHKKLLAEHDEPLNHWFVRQVCDKIDREFANSSPYIFEGLQYNLDTSEFLNAKSISNTTENPEKRKEWRSMLIKHKRMLKSMISIGMFDKYMAIVEDIKNNYSPSGSGSEDIHANRNILRWYGIPWNKEDICEYTTTCMSKGEIPDLLIKMYAFHFHSSISHRFNNDTTVHISMVDDLFSTFGFAFKKYLGVFDEVGYKKSLNKSADLKPNEYDGETGKQIGISMEDIEELFSDTGEKSND